jgi:hypothetical protein
MFMKLSRTAIVLIGLVLALPAAPAQAAAPQVSLSVGLRWQVGGTQGLWTPYLVSLRNSGSEDFSGDLYLVPNDVRLGPSDYYPVHRAHVTVARGGQRTATFYVIDAPNAYHAEARDASGHVVASAEVGAGTTVQGTSALAVLSDLTQGDQKISAPLHALSRVDSAITHFANAQAFPTSAVYLTGLNGIVVDDFDTAALSQAQVQTLKDFVGLGGVLVEAGGPSWRRTLLPLPSDLLPLAPQGTTISSMAALWELGGRTEEVPAQIASGLLRFGQVALAAGDGTPLIVDAAYGAGRVIELAFDPFGDPFASDANLAGLAWAQAISRGLSGVEAATRPSYSSFGGGTFSSVAGGAALAAPGIWAPGYGSGNEQLIDLLNNSPAASSPPVGLLGGLLVAYVLLVGLLNYLFLHTLRRRDLMWATVPAVALVFTAGAYVVGFALRGADFFVTQVEIQRLAPGGTAETYTFSGVYAPQRGDFQVRLPANTLVSTAIAQSTPTSARNSAVVTQSSRPAVLLQDVPIWAMRNLQTLSVSRPTSPGDSQATMGLSTSLRLESGHIKGTVLNRTGHPVRQLELVNGAGNVGLLADDLAAGSSLQVDTQLNQGNSISSSLAGPADTSPEGERNAVLRLAASQVLGGRSGPGDLALVGLTSPSGSLTVDDQKPTRSSLAAVVEPVGLQSADSLGSLIRAKTRLVSTYSGDGSTAGLVDVYDLEIPRGVTGALQLGYVYLNMANSPVGSVEVYDWSTHTWRTLPAQGPPYRGQQTEPLGPGEVAGGVLRARIHESAPYDSQLTVSGQ